MRSHDKFSGNMPSPYTASCIARRVFFNIMSVAYIVHIASSNPLASDDLFSPSYFSLLVLLSAKLKLNYALMFLPSVLRDW